MNKTQVIVTYRDNDLTLTIEEAKEFQRIIDNFFYELDFPLSPSSYKVVTDVSDLEVGDTIYTYEGYRAYDTIVRLYEIEEGNKRKARVFSLFVDDEDTSQCRVEAYDCILQYDGDCSQISFPDGIHVIKKDGR